MSDNKKIGGILIENSIKSDGRIVSVVGLGLNVNQTNFNNLPKASSLSVIFNAKFDREDLLFTVIDNLEKKIKRWNEKPDILWQDYSNKLFKKGIPMPFSDVKSQNFMGIIKGVSAMGKLIILSEDGSISEFDIKEIQMLY